MEQELSDLYHHLEQVRQEHVVPVRQAKPLVNGHDLIEELALAPGPKFKILLGAVEEAQMEGRVSTRAEALSLAQSVASRLSDETNPYIE